MKKNIAIYPGTFDPFTNGHLDLVNRSLVLFDEVIVAIASSLQKRPLFSLEERLALIRKSLINYRRIKIVTFDGLLVNYAKSMKISVIIRGLRAVSDFEYEFQMALTNRKLNPDIETLFMMHSDKCLFLTASTVREIGSLGGSVKGLVPVPVEKELINKFNINSY